MNKVRLMQEAARCLLCENAPCTAACHAGDPARAVKPVAQRFILEIAQNAVLQDAQLSGIGGIYTWRDALEFIQLGCRNVQVCTAVMEYGYRMIDDFVLGLRTYMATRGVDRVDALVGEAVSRFILPSEADRDTVVYPVIDRELCVGCHLCRLICRTGAIGISKRVPKRKKA